MKIVFLDAASMGETPIEEISSLGEYTAYPNSTPAQARERVGDCEVLIVCKVIVDEQLLACAPKLKLICEAATGVNNIDLDAASRRGIIVRNVTAYSTDSVVQATFAHLLSLTGYTSYFDTYVKDGRYSNSNLFTDPSRQTIQLAGKTIGIIGMGNIGSKVAAVASSFGMNVIYYSTSGTSHCSLYASVSLEDLLKTADVVSIHAPLNEKTANLIGEKELRLMKTTAFLLNMGRGGIVDETALAQAVDEGVIAGAGLDVFMQEPLPASSPLLSVRHPERFSFSPHSAWGSEDSHRRLVSRTADNIKQGW